MKNWNMSPVCFSRSNFGNGICLTISLYTISGQRKNKIKFAWNCAYSPIYISLCGKQTLPPRWPCITTLLITSSTSISRPLRTLFFSQNKYKFFSTAFAFHVEKQTKKNSEHVGRLLKSVTWNICTGNKKYDYLVGAWADDKSGGGTIYNQVAFVMLTYAFITDSLKIRKGFYNPNIIGVR